MSRTPIRLVLRNILKHKLRSLLTVASLAVALFLLACLRSLVVSLDAGVREAKSNRIIVQSAVSLFVDLPQSYEGKIQAVDGVESTCGWNWFGGYFQDPGNFFAQFAVREETLLPIYPEIEIVEGSAEEFLSRRTSCLVGENIASRFGWKVGENIPIMSALYTRVDGTAWEFYVAGIYRSNASNVDNATLFFHYEFLEETLEQGAAVGPQGVGIYVAKVADAADPVAVMGAIDRVFENGPQRVQSTSEAEFQAQFVSMVGNIPFFVAAIGGGVFLAILLAIVNTMLMSAREQTHDVGILKALGFQDGVVFRVFLLQSVFLAVVGGTLGLVLALLSSDSMASVLGTTFPNYRVTGETLWVGLAISLAIGLVAGLVPAWRLSRSDCVESLRAEA